MDDTTELVGRLKRSAIDAYMRGLHYRAEGDRYIYMMSAPGIVTRPGTDGYDGGDVLEIPTEHPRAGVSEEMIAEGKIALARSLNDAWSAIRDRIDAAIAPWLTIPTHGMFDSALQDTNRLVAGLMGAVTQSSGLMTGSGDFAASFNRVLEESTAFGGGALDYFKVHILDPTPVRAARITALCELLGEAAAAEQKVWAEAGEERDALLASYSAELRKVAEGASANIEHTLSVIGAAAAGAAIFTPAGTATAIALAGAGVVVSLAKDLRKATGDDEVTETRTFADAESGLDAFEKAIAALSSRVREEEDHICTALSESVANVHANTGMFQLAPAPIYQWESGVMWADFAQAYSLARSYLPYAADTIRAARSLPETISSGSFSALLHDASAGGRVAGAFQEVESVARLITALLDELASDLERGAQNLELALNDREDDEAAHVAALDVLASEIESAATHDGRPAEDLLNPPSETDTTLWRGSRLRDLMSGS